MNKTFETLENLLKKDERFVSQDGKIMRNAVYEASNKMDEALLALLMSDEKIKEMFFKKVNDIYVYDKQKFNFVISNRQMLPDSYTRYRQDIGLINSKDEYISATNDVVLSFPFKDCVLEFDSTDPDQNRKEVFFNEILAHDEIDHLFSNKVLSNAKLVDKDGEKEITEFIDDSNLLIKGNNLLAMYSLLPRYKGEIKLMYWDILYNTKDDRVPYADSFKHSSWLVMMKNRLEVAKQLLREDGVICLQCDDIEMAYLKVLMDEMFDRKNFLSCIVIESGGTLFGTKVAHIDKTFVKQKDYILVYAAKNNSITVKPLYDAIEPFDTHYNKIIINPNETYSLLEYIRKSKEIVKIFEKYNISIQVENINKLIKIDNDFAEIFYKNIAPILYQDCPYTNNVEKENLDKLEHNEIVEINGVFVHMTTGNKFRFYKCFKDCLNIADDYKMSYGRTGFRGDLWKGFGEDMKNVEDEGGVKLKNGKKPERLVNNILKSLTNENDIVLDAYFGTGTTGAVAMKMGRRFIGIEQLNDHIELAKKRLKNVINGDETGISKVVDWKGGGYFVYCELKKLNEQFIDEIKQANTNAELSVIWNKIGETGFVSCFAGNEKIKEIFEDIDKIEIDTIKKILIEILDKNQLYVNYEDMNDIDFKVKDEDKEFTESFYDVK